MNYRATAILNHSYWSKNLIKACQIGLLMAISDINTGKQVLVLSEIEQSVLQVEVTLSSSPFIPDLAGINE